MEKPKLYCDFDGVMLNTIEVAFQMMTEKGYDITDANQRNDFFQHEVDWIKVFDQATVINNSVERIKELSDSDIFSEIVMLTKLSGRYDEERLKREFINDSLNNIRVVTLQYGLNKALVVPSKNNILVDDELKNCKQWNNANGTAILFSSDNHDFKRNVIDDLIDIPNTKGVKKLLKTRKF